MRYLILFLLFCFPVFAADEKPAIDVPVISYGQKVEIVYESKKNPQLLDLKIEQDKAAVTIDAMVDRSVERKSAQKIAENLVFMTKFKSLDDKPTEKDEPGTGLYDYRVNIRRTDAVIILVAKKLAKEKKIAFEASVMEDVMKSSRPLTRADAKNR